MITNNQEDSNEIINKKRGTRFLNCLQKKYDEKPNDPENNSDAQIKEVQINLCPKLFFL